MANRYLLPLYTKLYGKKFDYSNFEQRMEMQKAIYLLQVMGVPVGDYGFRWYFHGPYSQELQDDMYFEDGRRIVEPILSEEYVDSIDKLYNMIHSTNKGNYSTTKWVECLASLHYLFKNVMSFNASMKDAVYELEKRKKHLDQHEINISAGCMLEELFG